MSPPLFEVLEEYIEAKLEYFHESHEENSEGYCYNVSDNTENRLENATAALKIEMLLLDNRK